MTGIDPLAPGIAWLGRALRPAAGETLCGDQIDTWLLGERRCLALADGLGHGAQAHRAAVLALARLRDCAVDDIAACFARCDQALIDTRGAAVALMRLPAHGAGTMEHATVGNIRALLVRDGTVRRLGGMRGIVGAGFAGFDPERLKIEPGDWLAMYSDGIQENAPIAERLSAAVDPDDLARAIVTELGRADDDAALLIYRHP